MILLKILMVFFKLKCIESYKWFVKDVFPLISCIFVTSCFIGFIILCGMAIFWVWSYIEPVSANNFMIRQHPEGQNFFWVSAGIGGTSFVALIFFFGFVEFFKGLIYKLKPLIKSNWQKATIMVKGNNLNGK